MCPLAGWLCFEHTRSEVVANTRDYELRYKFTPNESYLLSKLIDKILHPVIKKDAAPVNPGAINHTNDTTAITIDIESKEELESIEAGNKFDSKNTPVDRDQKLATVTDIDPTPALASNEL